MNWKRTKIVTTISDKRAEPEFIRSLYKAGMNVVRINTAHQDIEGSMRVIQNIRRISDKIAILIDTKGPEVRTTICDGSIDLREGEIIKIIGEPETRTTHSVIAVTYPDFANDVPVGSHILIDDGILELITIKKDGNTLECKVMNDASIGSRKSVNIPRVKLNLPSVSEKDKRYIDFAIENDIDFIAHSFVRSAEDIKDVQEILDKKQSKIKIIAKIENQDGVDNINEILENAYGIMVARGDLAIEIPYEKIPGIQRKIIDKCIKKRKPVIVATQMLYSMIDNPRPTRAEVSDIANAIYWKTDAIMLSGETAYGKYPVESVEAMNRVAKEAEKHKETFLELPAGNLTGEVSAYLAKVAVKTASRVGARCIIADTVRGRTIRNMAAFRGINYIMAQCYSTRTMRELALSYGVYPGLQEKHKSTDMFLKVALNNLLKAHELKDNDMIVVLAGNFNRGAGSSYIEVGSVEYLKDRIS
ncbi:MAG TPA: pyruvate kinase [Bacteroidales bacterium]|nr:pyruvate kinase [Bacteroidales bacterium]